MSSQDQPEASASQSVRSPPTSSTSTSSSTPASSSTSTPFAAASTASTALATSTTSSPSTTSVLSDHYQAAETLLEFQKVASGLSPDVAQLDVATTLHRFKEFPPEIRLMIWKIKADAERKPRTIRLIETSDEEKPFTLKSDKPSPVLLQVNTESRAEMERILEQRQLLKISPSKVKPFFVDNDMDTLHLNESMSKDKRIITYTLRNLGKPDPDMPAALNGNFSGFIKEINLVKRVSYSPGAEDGTTGQDMDDALTRLIAAFPQLIYVTMEVVLLRLIVSFPQLIHLTMEVPVKDHSECQAMYLAIKTFRDTTPQGQSLDLPNVELVGEDGVFTMLSRT